MWQLKQMQMHTTIVPEHFPTCQPEQQTVAYLSRRTTDGNLDCFMFYLALLVLALLFLAGLFLALLVLALLLPAPSI